jgi:hypothetical protein
MPKTSDKYFQFPLCALSYDDNFLARLNSIISFSCVQVGQNISQGMSAEEKLDKAYENKYKINKTFDKKYKIHIDAIIGANQLDVNIHDFRSFTNAFKLFDEYNTIFEDVHGRDVNVRIATNLLWDTINNKFSYREFSVLCAVYSCIGNKTCPVLITRSQIQCRQLGYKSQAVISDRSLERTDGAIPLSFRQINYTLNALHERGFFSRARANMRQTYYSNKLNKDEICEELFKSKTRRRAFQMARCERDLSLMHRIKDYNRSA